MKRIVNSQKSKKYLGFQLCALLPVMCMNQLCAPVSVLEAVGFFFVAVGYDAASDSCHFMSSYSNHDLPCLTASKPLAPMPTHHFLSNSLIFPAPLSSRIDCDNCSFKSGRVFGTANASRSYHEKYAHLFILTIASVAGIY